MPRGTAGQVWVTVTQGGKVIWKFLDCTTGGFGCTTEADIDKFVNGESVNNRTGPYWYAYWTEGSSTKSEYVGKKPPRGVSKT